MKYLSVQDLSDKSNTVWEDLLSEQEMVITNDGHPIAVLSATSEADLEQTIAALYRIRVKNAIFSMQKNLRKNNLDRISQSEIDREIHDSRLTRK